MSRRKFHWIALAVALVSLAALVSACGGGGSDSTSSASTEATGGGETTEAEAGSGIEAEAAELAAEAETPPTTVPEAEPLKNTNIPKGKTVAFLGCGAEQCEEYFPPIQEGAEALGWTAKMYQGSVEPNKQVKFLEEIVKSEPDVFIACCIAPSLAKKYFNEMKAKGTISFMCCTAEEGTEGITKLVSIPSDKLETGKGLADFQLSEQGEELNVLYVNTEDFEVSKEYFEGYEAEVKRLCPECPVDQIQVGVEEIGKPSLSTKVVSYLRSHPDVNTVATLFGPLMIGVPAAMSAAGITDVNIGATASGPEALEAVKEGKENWTAVQIFGTEFGLWGLNVAVREFTGEPIGDETLTPEVLITPNNAAELLPNPGNNPVIPDALQQYEELWGLK